MLVGRRERHADIVSAGRLVPKLQGQLDVPQMILGASSEQIQGVWKILG